MYIQENIPLASYTTFHIGGPARYFITVANVDELKQSLDFARDQNQQVLILGGGSNMLVPDAGWGGLVIKIEIKGVEIHKEGENVLMVAGAGERWDGLVERAVQENLWGIENLSGIPGTVGGAVVQNIGAYGAALSQTLEWVETYDTNADTESSAVKKMSKEECAFEYRESFFKHDAGRQVILRAAFALSSTPQPDVSYKDLAARFTPSGVEEVAGSSPSLAAIRDEVLKIRQGKFPDLSVEGTAGSFFKNPIVSAVEARALKERYPGLPLFIMPETEGIKVPLAWFLDSSHGVFDTLTHTVGGARLYEKQPLVIAARKNTPAHDVAMLAQKIKKEVKEKLHIEIEEEVRII